MQTASAKEVVRLSTGEWSPYISENLENKGILSQIATEAFAQKGIELTLDFFPWGRTTQLSKSGEWDGTLAFIRLSEREPFYLFTDPIYVGHYAFFHLKSYPFKWKDYGDLKNVLIASTIGFGGMGEEFIKAEKDGTIKVLRLQSDTQSFNMIMAKRAEVVPSDVEVGYVLAKKLYGKNADLMTHNSNYIVKSEYRVAISKKAKNAQALVDKFNEGLAQLRKSGRYDEILRSWYGKPIYKDAVPADYLKQNHTAKK
ncbi:substrate-binding periplasmic protein [Bdellovibrio sp. HCB337]|uniref:substrate-binding periplasmic protein n=1 Tax=Bdellovibrio sp. HCB337 TaxID=3394358 RepID=UPI0039A52734